MQNLVNQARELKKWEDLRKELEAEEAATEDQGADGKEEQDNTTTTTMQSAVSTSLWIYLYRCAKLGSRSLWKKKRNVILEEQIRTLCDRVIQHRLQRHKSEINDLNRKSNIPLRGDIVKCFCDMTDLMILQNPNLYSDIALKLNITFHEERSVCKAFSDFAEVLFSKGVTWPLIVSLLAFSSGLAAECAKHGRSILVQSISDWATVFIVMRLRGWIVENGKWDGMLRYFEPKKQTSDISVISERFMDELFLKYQTHDKSIHFSILVLVLAVLVYFVYARLLNSW